jgi:hypothetical protein
MGQGKVCQIRRLDVDKGEQQCNEAEQTATS